MSVIEVSADQPAVNVNTDPQYVSKLIKQLGHPRYVLREQAQTELELAKMHLKPSRNGPTASPILLSITKPTKIQTEAVRADSISKASRAAERKRLLQDKRLGMMERRTMKRDIGTYS